MSRHRSSLWAMVAALAALGLWSWLVLGTDLTRWLDARAPRPLSPDSTAGEVAAAIATVTWPGVPLVALWVVALWAQQRRFLKLATAVMIASVLAWMLPAMLKYWVGRPRPVSPFAGHFTSAGSSYPSTHVTMITATAIVLAAATTTSRQSRTRQLGSRFLLVLMVLMVSADRVLMAAHWPSDVVAGWLLGAATAGFALWVSGVRTVPAWEIMRPLPAVRATGGVAAVIYNPVKVTDEMLFRRHVADELAQRGWHRPIFLTTSPDDPGRAMADEAIARRVDRVLVAGGDGTVRVVCSTLAHSGIPVALIPAGTANLLARNLGVPMDEGAALDVAFDGDPYAIDLVSVRVDDQPDSDHFAVMGGIGIDALVMSATNEDLKRAVKSAAYFVAVAQNLGQRPVEASVIVDGREVSHRPASLMLVGNVGEIQAGLQLFPRAAPDDGLLDVILTGPRGLAGWVSWGLERVYRQLTQNVDTHQGKTVLIEVDEPLPYELDGDTIGEARVFEAWVDQLAVTVMLPRRPR